jgi:hypothetical protein
MVGLTAGGGNQSQVRTLSGLYGKGCGELDGSGVDGGMPWREARRSFWSCELSPDSAGLWCGTQIPQALKLAIRETRSAAVL